MLEQKQTIEPALLEQVAQALKVPADTIKNFSEEAAYNIISNTVTNNDNVASFQYNPTFNPVDKVVELFERLLASEKEKTDLMKEILDK